MASLYRQNNSQYWWIKYRDNTGVVRRESTGFRVGIGVETRRAQQMRAERTLDESKTSAAKPCEVWATWVPTFFALRYADSPKTRLRADGAWRNLAMFLEEKKILIPRQLTRDHCIDYMGWRAKPNKSAGKYRAGHNTAQLELKMLGIVMAEAVLRGYAAFSPCRDLHIKRLAPTKVKPALTDDAVALIRKKILLEPEPLRTFLNNSFEIAYHHGVRLSETHLNPMTHVEFIGEGDKEQARISFTAKGNKTHTVMLHPKLLPLFRSLREKRKTETYAPRKSPAKEWFLFLHRAGLKKLLPGISFHSTRVNAASVLARAGVSEKKAMAYLGHASTTVHRSYVRLRAEDLTDCAAAIS